MSHRLLYILPSLLFLSGCQVMSEKECRTADWYQTGYNDGREGEPRSRIEDITEACAKTKVTPDQNRYFSGRTTGLREYCQASHGYDLGRNGSSFNSVCPPESAGQFESSWRAGRSIYDARQRVERLESKRDTLEGQLSREARDKEKHHIRETLEENDRQLRNARDDLRRIENSVY